ncbi:MAG: hypothetical protein AVDCRST_MAG05-5127, partial [uncultured Rubrobacteraceae bacterium]
VEPYPVGRAALHGREDPQQQASPQAHHVRLRRV